MTSSYDIHLEELDETFEQALQPTNTKINLWSHQLTLLQRCKQYENEQIPLNSFETIRNSQRNLNSSDFIKTKIGIIGDRVGSGKSFVILSLILDNDISNNQSILKAYGKNKLILSCAETSRNIKTNLLVIPHNLISQWEDYIKTFSDSLRYYIISQHKHVEALFDNTIHVADYQLFIVTASFYSRLAHYITSRSLKFQRVIYDEIDNMNLPNCMSIDSNFYWFVTASYANCLHPKGYSKWDYSLGRHVWYATGLKNSGFVKDIFMDLYLNLSKDFVKILVLKNKDSYIETSVSLPPIETITISCKTPITINVLDGFVEREVINSLNAGDVANAIRIIAPTHRNTEDNLISIQIDKYVREIRNCDIRINFTQTLEFNTEAERQNELERLINRKNEIEKKIEGIQQRIHNNNTCCICYDDIKNKAISPCCSNPYCFLCVNIWLAKHKNCPLCKKQLEPKDLLVVDETTISKNVANVIIPNPNEFNENFDKLKNLEIILKKRATEGKILIYSSYDMSFQSIINILINMQLEYKFLKGNESQLKKTLDRYKTGDLNILLVNTRNYGCGINLENTTDIIMFHKVESETEKQVIGRAQRHGRSTSLKVWYLLYENEIHSRRNI